MSDDDTISIVETLREMRRLEGHAPSYQSLWTWVATGSVPAERVGRSWRIRREDVPRIVAWIRRPRHVTYSA